MVSTLLFPDLSLLHQLSEQLKPTSLKLALAEWEMLALQDPQEWMEMME